MAVSAVLASSEPKVWFLDYSFLTRRASYSTRTHVLMAAIVLLLTATATANHHATDVYEIKQQPLKSALAKGIIPCLLDKQRMESSLLSVSDYYSSYPSLKVPPSVTPIPILAYLTCKYHKLCTVNTPRPHDRSLLASILHQLYDQTMFVPSSTGTNVPQTFPTNKYTNENVKYQLIPATSKKAIDDNLKTVSKVTDEQSTTVTDTLQIPAAVDINVTEEKNTPAYYNGLLTVPDKVVYNLSTEVDSISGTMSEFGVNVTDTSGGILDAMSNNTTLRSSQKENESRRDSTRKCEEKNSSRLSSFNTNKITEKDGTLRTQNKTSFDVFKQSLLHLERSFLFSSFTKLTAISPEERKVNGISFIQSGLFLHLLLIALTTEVDPSAVKEIEDCLELCASNKSDRIAMLKQVISWLPESSDSLKFRWSSRLVVNEALHISPQFRNAAEAMNFTLSHIPTDNADVMAKTLNDMVDKDSGGTMHDTFEEDEMSRGACGVALTTVYIRPRWRAAPTLLNGTGAFRDGATTRTTRFFRVNDVVRYAYLPGWEAEAIDIPYATPGLSLLVVVPREPSLRTLVERVASDGLGPLVAASREVRASIILPLYTLRMALLLPNKLIHMGMPSLVDVNNNCRTLKFTHAVQRLMFWSEAGRNAYKDDGIEWDPHPDLDVKVDRPYLFFVRWHNVTLLNGNFVL